MIIFVMYFTTGASIGIFNFKGFNKLLMVFRPVTGLRLMK